MHVFSGCVDESAAWCCDAVRTKNMTVSFGYTLSRQHSDIHCTNALQFTKYHYKGFVWNAFTTRNVWYTAIPAG